MPPRSAAPERVAAIVALVALASVIVLALGQSGVAAPDRIDGAASAAQPAVRQPGQVRAERDAKTFEIGCGWPEARVAASGAPRVSVGSTTIYAGTAQVTSDNQDPRLVRFDDGVPTWCRSDIETTGDDHRGYGLLWDGADRLLMAISVTGTQGTPDQDLRRVARDGWLRSYTDASTGGGGPKASIVVAVDPSSGDPTRATYVTARLSNGRVNSLTVTAMAFRGEEIIVDVSSFFSPRRADRTPMQCSGSSPFDVRYVFSSELDAVSDVASPRCR